MGNTSTNWTHMSDSAIIDNIGRFLKQERFNQNKTQTQLAEIAGLNRWTISQIENGESITLTSLVQILRALDKLHVLSEFDSTEEISPLEYAKLKKKQRARIRNKEDNTEKGNTTW
jgi:transcriptional regulator with XRE-family HTH domain